MQSHFLIHRQGAEEQPVYTAARFLTARTSEVTFSKRITTFVGSKTLEPCRAEPADTDYGEAQGQGAYRYVARIPKLFKPRAIP